ncbi:MAG: SRPBCC family protein [Cytophagia bacterium]|nr:SRPBCC family protein [Cytophagia bacterium]
MKFAESILIESKSEKIFNITQDYKQRLLWDTFLKKAELIGTDEARLGQKAWCVSKHGLGMETEYISFNRPKVTAIKQSRKSLLFKSFAGSWVFEDRGPEATEVTFTYSYQLNFPFSVLKSLLNKILVKNVQQRLKDLKRYTEFRL